MYRSHSTGHRLVSALLTLLALALTGLTAAAAAPLGQDTKPGPPALADPLEPKIDVYCVGSGATPAPPCTNTTAIATIQAAIAAAAPGSEIRVAAGTYGGFDLNKNVTLIGGYPGGSAAGWTTPGSADDAKIEGTINVTVAATIRNFTVGRVEGGVTSVAGPATLTIRGTVVWLPGIWEGPGAVAVAAGATLNISGDSSKELLKRTINNAGTINWTGNGPIIMQDGAIINNLAGGSFRMLNNSFFNAFSSGDPSTFNNAGTFIKLNGSGSFSTGPIVFNNSGTLDVRSGGFNPSGGGTSSGPIVLAAGTLFQIGGALPPAPYTFASTTISGTGVLSISRGVLNLGGAVNAPFVEQGGGTIDGPGDLTVRDFHWTDGTQGGSGVTSIPAGGTAIVEGLTNHVLSGRTLSIGGTARLRGRGAILMVGSARLTTLPGGVLNLEDEFGFNAGTCEPANQRPIFNNRGTFVKTGGESLGQCINIVNSGIFRLASGRLNLFDTITYVQNGGETVLAGGEIALPLIDTAAVLNGGILRGNGELDSPNPASAEYANLTNMGGTVSPGLSAGSIMVGNYTQGPTATLAIEIGGRTPATQFDQLKVARAATLNGTLQISVINGFEPALGDTFLIMPYASHSGTYPTILGSSLPNGLRFEPHYNATDLTLVVVEDSDCTRGFSDVATTYVFYPYIRNLVCRGIISGYADHTFRPGNSIIRGQVAKVVANSAGFADAIPANRQSFKDVSPADTFWLFIERAYAHHVIDGYNRVEDCGAGNVPCFKSYNNVTRGQFAKIVANARGYDETRSGQTFQDVPTSHPFYIFIERIAARNIISGYNCGAAPAPACQPGNRPYFLAFNNITRGQASKIDSIAFFGDTPRK